MPYPRASTKHRELCGMLGVHLEAINGTLRRLKRKGYVDWQPSRPGTLVSRGIVIAGEVG